MEQTVDGALISVSNYSDYELAVKKHNYELEESDL